MRPTQVPAGGCHTVRGGGSNTQVVVGVGVRRSATLAGSDSSRADGNRSVASATAARTPMPATRIQRVRGRWLADSGTGPI